MHHSSLELESSNHAILGCPNCKVGNLGYLVLFKAYGDENWEITLRNLGSYTGGHQRLSYGINLNEDNVVPVKNSILKEKTLAAHKQLSYENLVSAWLMSDGWEVLIPAIDHGKKTDLVAADDSNFYRIQVKSIESSNESISVENKWKGAEIDYVIYFSRTGEWGYITPAFKENKKRLNASGHIRFHPHPTNFLKAFRKI